MYVLDVCLLTVNIARNKPIYQQYPYVPGGDRHNASNAVDGRKSDIGSEGGQCAVSWDGFFVAWWVNLRRIYSIHHITIYLMRNTLGIVTVVNHLFK